MVARVIFSLLRVCNGGFYLFYGFSGDFRRIYPGNLQLSSGILRTRGVFCDPNLVLSLLVWLFGSDFGAFSCSGEFGEVISAFWADFAVLATRFPYFCPFFCFYARIFVSARVRGVGLFGFLCAFACTAVASSGVLRVRLLLAIYSLLRVVGKCQNMAKYGNIAVVGC